MTDSMFQLNQTEKDTTLTSALTELTTYHRRHCSEYDRLLHALSQEPEQTYYDTASIPWLPVRLFKELDLKSIDDTQVFKTLTSSGTTGAASRIYLDKEAASAQQKALSATLRTVIGNTRLPMLLVDSSSLFKNRTRFSARGAGVLGLMNFGRSHSFVLDDNDQPDITVITQFLANHGEEPFLIFGFTFMVWQYLYEIAKEHHLDLSNGILIHSGGWKKLADRAVDNSHFRNEFAALGLKRIHNFYGMVEQIGTVYLEGPDGNCLYSPDFADIIIRDPRTFEVLPTGQPGLIQVMSSLPRSYPGHALLTEDLGVIHGIDDGVWPGKRFSVLGRLPRAEARGCSDTFNSNGSLS